MAPEIEGREGSCGERRKGEKSMEAGGSPSERVLARPWAPLRRDEDPFDPEGRDEETIPRIDPGMDSLQLADNNSFTEGPWNDSEFNPFNKNLWMPSWDPLVTRDNAGVDLEAKNLLFNVPTKPRFDFTTPETLVSMSKTEETHLNPHTEKGLFHFPQ